MNRDIIYSSEYIILTRRLDDYFIESFRLGMSIEQLNKLLSEHPEIKVTSFMAIKNAILFPPKPATKFGEAKERITIDISSDEMRAYITLAAAEEDLTGDRKINLIKDLMKKLNEKGILFGIKHEVILNSLCNNKQLLIAEGIPPQNGTDSVIRMYEMKEAKPEAKEDGNVDHYELNLINKVRAGAWLGERHDPGRGIEGKSVKGNVMIPLQGKKYPLSYDRKSVKEVYENGVTTLFSIREGAVNYDGDRISVSNHLEITNNVDFKTGNIDFEGYLTVKGSVEDNFSVTADKDIEILGDYGVGSIREIVSRKGSVYIKGGIAGKSKAVVKSKRDIYTKFVSDATIVCEGSVHIGFYCLNSNITAKEVILDSPKGQIIGGSIQAEIKVVSSIIGSTSEKRTMVCVKGFDRNALKSRLERLMEEIETVKNKMAKAKQEVAIYTNTTELKPEQLYLYEQIKGRYFNIRDELRGMEDEKKVLVNYLRTRGEGEISILKKAYPNTMLEIKKSLKDINKEILGTTFYYQDGDIRELI
jgi:uncharacterized protein